MKKCFLMGLVLVLIFMMSGCFNPFENPLNGSNNDDTLINELISDEPAENSVEKNLEEHEKVTEENAEKFVTEFNDTTKSIYYDAMEKLTKQSDENSDESWIKRVLKNSYGTYSNLRMASPTIIITSIILGGLGALISRNNKGARRFFIISFIIAIPLLDIIAILGIGALNNLFLYK